jgi:hypothetical protein
MALKLWYNAVVMKRRPLIIPLFFGLWMFVVALACNLSSDARPPTIAPRATNTPPPTIGYATLPPNQLPPQATVMPQQSQTQTTLLNLINQVAADRLSMHIAAMQGFYTRHANSTQSDPARGVGAAANYILDQFYQIRDNSYQNSFVVQTQDFPVEWAGSETIGTNVFGILQGTETGAGVLLIGAHYDSISVDFEDGSAYAPGANDNGSGVAALIEIARIMSQQPHRMTVMFVAFAAEEVQRQGSQAFINDYINNVNAPFFVNYMLNMDIIGSSMGPNGAFDDNHIRLFSAEPNNSPSRQLARMLNLITARYVPDMSIILETSADREGRYSDHVSFNDAGFAAVRFIEALEDPNLQHTDRDTWERMRPGYLTRSTQVILACMTALADGPRPPQNIQLRQNSNGSRTLVWDFAPDAASYVVALRAPNSPYFNQTFPVIGNNSGEWGKFTPEFYEGVAVAAVDENGLMGPVSFEYAINN